MKIIGCVKELGERISLGEAPVQPRYKIPRAINKKFIVDMKLADGEVVEISMRSTGWLQVANFEIDELLGTLRYVLKMCFKNNRSKFVELIVGNVLKSNLRVKFVRIQNLVDSYNNDVGDLSRNPSSLSDIRKKWS